MNASFPAACGMRFTTAMRIHDMVLGALAQAMPGTVPAGGGNTLVITYISTSELGAQGRVVVANPVPAGSGGGGERDGISGTEIRVAFLRNVPVEVLEVRGAGPGAPVRPAAGLRRARAGTAAGSAWSTSWRSAIRAPSS